MEALQLSTGLVENLDDRESGSSSTQALFNSVSILMGVGILSIPYALNQGGWATLGVLALIWLSTNHTGKLLVKCQEYYNTHPSVVLPAGTGIQTRGGVVQTCVPYMNPTSCITISISTNVSRGQKLRLLQGFKPFSLSAQMTY